jgi:hypothetical protein
MVEMDMVFEKVICNKELTFTVSCSLGFVCKIKGGKEGMESVMTEFETEDSFQ